MTKPAILSPKAIKAFCDENHDRVIVITTEEGEFTGICEGFFPSSEDGEPAQVVTVSFKEEMLGMTTAFGGPVVPIDQIIGIRRQSDMHLFPEGTHMTYSRAAFLLPEDPSIRVELVQAIDETFYLIDGSVCSAPEPFRRHPDGYETFAPVELVIGLDHTSTSVEFTSGIMAWRLRSAPGAARAGFDARRALDALTSVSEGKPLHGVILDRLDLSPRHKGLRNDLEAQRYLIDLITPYLLNGYGGKLTFANHSYSEAHTKGRVEEVVFHLEPWEDRQSGSGRRAFDRVELPPAIELLWDKKLGGVPENMPALLEVIRAHKLEQVPPLRTWRQSWMAGWRPQATRWQLGS